MSDVIFWKMSIFESFDVIPSHTAPIFIRFWIRIRASVAFFGQYDTQFGNVYDYKFLLHSSYLLHSSQIAHKINETPPQHLQHVHIYPYTVDPEKKIHNSQPSRKKQQYHVSSDTCEQRIRIKWPIVPTSDRWNNSFTKPCQPEEAKNRISFPAFS